MIKLFKKKNEYGEYIEDDKQESLKESILKMWLISIVGTIMRINSLGLLFIISGLTSVLGFLGFIGLIIASIIAIPLVEYGTVIIPVFYNFYKLNNIIKNYCDNNKLIFIYSEFLTVIIVLLIKLIGLSMVDLLPIAFTTAITIVLIIIKINK